MAELEGDALRAFADRNSHLTGRIVDGHFVAGWRLALAAASQAEAEGVPEPEPEAEAEPIEEAAFEPVKRNRQTKAQRAAVAAEAAATLAGIVSDERAADAADDEG